MASRTRRNTGSFRKISVTHHLAIRESWVAPLRVVNVNDGGGIIYSNKPIGPAALRHMDRQTVSSIY